MMIKPEILAPAGSPESFDYALAYGADAVYLAGKSFGMRSGANNFDSDQLRAAVKTARSRGVKVYLTCNTIPREYELDGLVQFMKTAADAGVDAFIIGDMGVFDLARRFVPDVPVHISTQTGVANSAAANLLHSMGASRVVLARELSLDEIRSIRANTHPSLEIEAFVHGSMCVSFSGRCLLSNYLTGRDANRGDCAQPCRWKYALMEETRPGEYFPIGEDEHGTHILNSRDMCMINHIDKLAEAGITSFKIEGRAKSSYYAAVVTNAYRCAVDEYAAYLESGSSDPFVLPAWIANEVMTVSHREYATGFYFGNAPGQVYDNGGYVREYEVAAVVESWDNGRLTARQRNRFFEGDTLEIVRPGQKPEELVACSMTNADGEPISATPHPDMVFSMPCETPLEPRTILRRRKLNTTNNAPAAGHAYC